MLLKRAKPRSIVFMGMVSLVLANTIPWFLRHHSHVSENRVDLTQGFLMGLAIGTLILGIVAMKRQG